MAWLSIIALLVRYLGPIISTWFAVQGHTSLSLAAGDVGASQEDLTTLYAAWSAIAAACIGAGETAGHYIRRAQAGPITVDQIRKIIELILKILEMFLPADKAAQAHSLIVAAFPVESHHLGLRR